MVYIRKNVNFLLIILVITLIALFVGFTSYYESNNRTLKNQYTDKSTQYDSLTSNLSVQKTQLEKTYSELQLQVAGGSKLQSLYNEVLQEKKKIEDQLSKTQGQLSQTQTELANTITQLRKTEADLAVSQANYLDAQNKVNVLTSDVSSKQSKINNLCLQLRTYDPNNVC